jgi:O-antigen/teichoic acid export membrane protein
VPDAHQPIDDGPIIDRSRAPVRNAALLSAAEVIGKVASLGLALVAARRLDQASFGSYSFALSLALLLAVVPSWGFDQLLVQRASSGESRLDELVANTLVWRLVLGGLVMTACAVTVSVAGADAAIAALLMLLVASAVVDTFTDTGKSAAAVVRRQGGVAASLVFQRCTTASLAIVALVLFSHALVWIAVAYLIGSIVGFVSTSLVVHRLGIRWFGQRPSQAGIRSTGRRSMLIGFEVVVAMVLFRIDTPILQAMRGSREVAVYAVAYKITETTLFLSWTLAAVALPLLAAHRDDPAGGRRILESAIAAAAAFYVPFACAALVAPQRILGLLFGARYGAQAATGLRWLALTPLLFGIWQLGGHVLIAYRRFAASLAITAVCAVLNLGANIALLRRFGAPGAAAATTITFAVGALFTLVALRPDIGLLNVGRALGIEILAGLAMAAALLLSARAPVMLSLAVAVALDAIVWWALARRWAPAHLAAVIGLVRRR